MNTRIKKIRRELDLTQQAFAEKIGMKQNSIALIESGKRNISDQAILSICREFNVNEEWIRFGCGEMFATIPSAGLDMVASEYSLSHSEYILIEKFVRMKPEKRGIITDFILEAAAAISGSDVPINTTTISGELLDSIPKTPEEFEKKFPPINEKDKEIG